MALTEENIKYCVVIVDGSPLFREALARLLHEDAEFGNVAETGDKQLGMFYIDRLQPDVIVFLSRLAYDKFNAFCQSKGVEYAGVAIAYVSHPASWWWNREDGSHGKQKFEDLLRANWI